MGKALHAALAEFHQWPEWREKPSLKDLENIWQTCSLREGLPREDGVRGLDYLKGYYEKFVKDLPWRLPLACEGKIEGNLYMGGIGFKIGGRFDRLDSLPTGDNRAALHLIDYKLGKTMLTPKQLELDLQLGLMQIALDQNYQQRLMKVSHIYLKKGESLTFETRAEQREIAKKKIEELALRLTTDQEFQATPGEHCSSCGCRKYCHAMVKYPQDVDTSAVIVQLSIC